MSNDTCQLSAVDLDNGKLKSKNSINWRLLLVLRL